MPKSSSFSIFHKNSQMPKFTRLQDCVVTNKNVIVRVDINVPMSDNKIEDDTRIKAVIPTLKYLLLFVAMVCF